MEIVWNLLRAEAQTLRAQTQADLSGVSITSVYAVLHTAVQILRKIFRRGVARGESSLI